MKCIFFGGGGIFIWLEPGSAPFEFHHLKVENEWQMHRLADRQLLKHITMHCDFIQEFTSLQPV